MTTSDKAGPGGSAPAPFAMFTLDDEVLFRLFNIEERDIVVQTISDAYDLPALAHHAAPGRRAGLAGKLRDRLLGSVVAYMDRLHEAGAGYEAREYQSAVRLMVEIQRISDVLIASEGIELSGDATVALGQALRTEWTTFIGEASAHRVFLDIPRELLARERRIAAARTAAKVVRPKSRSPLRVRIMGVMRSLKRDGASFKTLMQRWDLDKNIDGLTIALVETGQDKGKYRISDDRDSAGNGQPYGWGTLEKMFAQAR